MVDRFDINHPYKHGSGDTRPSVRNAGGAITGKLIIGKLLEFIGILTANCCTAILRPFQRCF
jgi:hypothetical protein